MLDYGKLYLDHLKNSKKVIFVSTIGIICAIALVSSSLLYVDASKGEIVSILVNADNKNQNYDIGIDMSYNNPNENTFSITWELNNITSSLMNRANLHFFSNLEMTYMIQKLETPQNYYWENNGSTYFLNLSLSIVQLNNGIRHDLMHFTSQNSTLPAKNASIQQAFALESFFESPKRLSYNYYKTHDLLDLQNSSIIPVFQSSIDTQVAYFNITGLGKVMQPSTFNPDVNVYTHNYYNPNYPALSKVWSNLNGPFLVLFVNNLTRYTQSFVPFNGVFSRQIQVYGGLNIDFKKADPLAIVSRTNDIINFVNSLQSKILNTEFYKTLKADKLLLDVQFTSITTYRQMQNAISQILFNMWLYAIPVVIVAILTSAYSFNLIYKKVIKQIGVFKTRGASKFLILFFELLDLLIVMILSLIVGTLVGFPIATLVTKMNFLLIFNNTGNYDLTTTFINNITNILGTLFIFSTVISLIGNMRRTLKLASLSIVETENPAENTDPFWKRHYLDIIMFIYGFVSYIIFIYLLNKKDQSINSVITIFMDLFLLSPFIMVVGAILIFNRVTPPILNRLGNFLWRARGGLLAFSLKNVLRNEQTALRAIILMASLLTFLVVFYSLPYSQVMYQQKTSLYENGAQGIILLPYPIANVVTINQLINNVSQELNNKFSNSLEAFSPFFTVFTSDYSSFGPEHLLFINSSSYLQASSIEQFHIGLKSDNSLQKDLFKLQTENNTVLMNQAAFNDHLLSLNDNITLKNSYNYNTTFQIIDAFSQWPVTSRFNWDTNTWFIMDMNHILKGPQKDLSKTFYTQISSLGFYLKFKDGVNKTAVTHDISVLTGLTSYTSSFGTQSLDTFNGLVLNFQIGQININIIMSIVIGIIIFIMFSYTQLIDRKKEIYTEIALGMKIRQTSVLFFVESMIILFSGIIIGTVLGSFFVQMAAVYMTRGAQIPSYEVITPWNLILVTYVGFITLAIISAIIPAYYIAKQDINR